MALHAISPAAASSRPRALNVRLTQCAGCGCLAKQSVLMSSSGGFTRLQIGTVYYVRRPLLVVRRSDKKAVLTHATIEEIEAEKSLIEDQAKEKMDKATEAVQSNFNTEDRTRKPGYA